MKNRVILSIAILSLGTFLLSNNAWAIEEEIPLETKVITINAVSGLNPVKVTSKPGTTVVWVNNSSTPGEIRFLDKKVTLACGSPVNFIHGEKGGYESSKIVEGGVASLCFLEKGSYQYTYKVSSTFYEKQEGKEYQGTIIIE